MTTTLKLRQTGKLGMERRVPSKDTILSPPTKEELEANVMRTNAMSGLDMGRRWVGDLTEKLNEIQDPNMAADMFSAVVDGIMEYGNELGKSNAEEGTAGALAFRRETPPENLDEEEKGKEEEKREFLSNGATSKREPSNDMKKWRNQDFARIESMQEANAKFWQRK
jgi:hypothetical protein